MSQQLLYGGDHFPPWWLLSGGPLSLWVTCHKDVPGGSWTRSERDEPFFDVSALSYSGGHFCNYYIRVF